jgi:hypothetical protein
MGLKFAGTGNNSVNKLIIETIEKMRKLKVVS